MKHKFKLFPRLMALFLTAVMLMGMVPGAAFAADAEPAVEELTVSTPTEETVAEAPIQAAPGDGKTAIVTARRGADVWEEPDQKGNLVTHLEMGTKLLVTENQLVEETSWGRMEDGWVLMTAISLEMDEPDSKEQTNPDSEASQETVKVEPPETTEEPQAEPDVENPTEKPEPEVLTAPVPLVTTAEYFEDFFGLFEAEQEGISYRFLTAGAEFQNPRIHAYSFDVEPDVESVGFEIRMEGVNYFDDPVVNPGGQLEVRIDNHFLNADSSTIQVLDISGDSWTALALDSFSVSGSTAVIRFWVPNINSRFAVIEGSSEVALYDEYYGESLGETTYMSCNNKTAWCVAGKNPYGFGNSKNGTFALHLVHRPSTDPSGRTTGYSDYVAGGCLEYWKKEPSISQGEIVNVNYGGSIGGWSSLSVAQRREIVSYMLYGVRYLSDGSFTNSGAATIYSKNPVVNMIYAQQVLIWCTVKGVDPWEAIYYWGQSVPHYAEKIMDLASRNPENYDYDRTLMMVGEGGSRQDLVVVLKPEKKEPPKGDISVDKAVTGSDLKSGWVMELYNSYSSAQSASYPIASATTDRYGQAKFTGLTPGQTYYIREAPASRQTNNTDSWTLSTQILSATVRGGVVTNAGTIQNSFSPQSPFTLHKISNCSEAVKQQLNGNKMYSLAGAKYKVSINGRRQEILTTDSNGNASSSKKYPVGTVLQIQEIEAPPGYKLNPDIEVLVITAGSNKIEVADVPVFDPPFAMTKVDKTTTVPQGDGSFSGAVFKWEYFDNTSWSGTPKRTWYFATDENGMSKFLSSYFAPGYRSDPLYVDDGGNPDIPLGTVTMTEIQNSLGYIVLPQPIRCSIVEDPSSHMGAKHVFTPESLKFIKDINSGNVSIYEPIDENLFGTITLDKLDAQTGSVPQGDMDLSAKFQVVNRSRNSVQIESFPAAAPGEKCYEFTTDADGHFSSGKIFPVGTYTIKEVTPPEGYQLNADWSQTFTVTADNQQFDFTVSSEKACMNQPDLIGTFEMDKLDIITGSTPQGEGTLEGAEFELINNSKHPVYVQESWNMPNPGTVVNPGEVLLTFKTDATGHFYFEGLPVGSYYLQEKNPPEGYEWDSIWQYDFSITKDTPNIKVESENTCQNYVKRGALEIVKQDSLTAGNTLQDAPLDGITFSVTNESKNPVVVDDVTYNPGEVVCTLSIAWDGQKWSAKTADILPYGTYGITENEMHPGMANDFYLINPEKHLVEIRESANTVSIIHVNEMVEGEIIIHKVDPLGKPLAGAKITLEWSEDNGATWTPVRKTDVLTKGGCTDPNLEQGSLTSGPEGLVTFSGLYPTLLYRVTEVEAPDGYVLLRDRAFEGNLPKYEYVYEMTVHNSPGFTFPTTGGQGIVQLTVFGATLISTSVLFLAYMAFYLQKKRVKWVKGH